MVKQIHVQIDSRFNFVFPPSFSIVLIVSHHLNRVFAAQLPNMSQYFGFELLYSSVKHDLAEKSDLLVVVFHWFLIRENFQCLGVGTEVSQEPTNTSRSCLNNC